MRPLATLALLPLLGAAPAAAPPSASCPSAEAIVAAVKKTERWTTRRQSELGIEIPARLVERAAARPGRPFANRDGRLFTGVIVIPLPAEPIWKAVSDEEHFDEAHGFLPLEVSRLIEGERGGLRRRLLQSFRRWGVKRWWVAESRVNSELFARSGGRMWEVSWRELEIAPEALGEEAVRLAETHSRIDANRGSWVLIPVGPSCTVAEYGARTEPGGFINLMQWLFATREVKRSLAGIAAMAARHIPREHAGDRFLRPDGRPFGGPPPAREPPAAR